MRTMIHPLQELVKQHKRDGRSGIYSVCSANPFVIEAAVQQALEDDSLLLVEATSNQVDQFGGYTGMKPVDFAGMVRRIAIRQGLSPERLILGGDHLGPNVWQNLPAQVAMDNARTQIATYVRAGFGKIHLDASMPLSGDVIRENQPLDAELAARRSAELCKVAEEAAAQNSTEFPKPVYVIGTDVPVPGGAKETASEIRVTPAYEVEVVLELTRNAFLQRGLEDAWQRVIAVVVQPGVEFGDQSIFEYHPEKALHLKLLIEQTPFIYEAHSTDYQTEKALNQMVRDHFAILKVGPALTFALREALFALTFIEDELAKIHGDLKASDLRSIVERAMIENPSFWQKHYHGNKQELAFARRFSFSDRIRYYWPQGHVQAAVNQLLQNLQKRKIPLTLLSQYLPEQYRAVRNGDIENFPHDLILHKIHHTLKDYAIATGQKKQNISSELSKMMETFE